MRPRRVRNSRARAIARMFLKEKELKHPPINVIKLIEKYGKIIWDKEAEEGFTVYHEQKNKYYVFINPRAIQGRKNWTLCHELAHIVLGHFIDFDMDNLSPREEKILDRECDIFVREFLMPEEWVFKYCKTPLTVPLIGKIKDKFDVSWQAITNRFCELNICQKVEIDELFNEWNSRREKVSICIDHSIVEIHYQKPIFASEINSCLSQGAGGKITLTRPIKIPNTDSNNRYTECPVCGNSIFSYDASFCKICGLLA